MKLGRIVESLLEEKDYKELSSDFNLNDLVGEIDKRKDKIEELRSQRSDVDTHYINKFNMYLSLVKERLNNFNNKVNLSNEDEIKTFFDDIDFYLRHAENLVGLPG